MNVESFSINSFEELPQIFNDLDFEPSLCICFCHPQFDIDKLINFANTHNLKLIGCSTSGEICDEGTYVETASVLLLDIEVSYFEVLSRSYKNQDAYATGAKISEMAKSQFKNPAILPFSGGIQIDGEQIILGLQSAFDQALPIYGGQAGDYNKMESTFSFSHQGVSDQQLVALIIDQDKICVAGKVYSGWEAMGKVHTVTKCVNNILYEIDNKSALDLFTNYFGNEIFDTSAPVDGTEIMAGQFPLRISNNRSESIMRSILYMNREDKSLILAGGIEEGNTFRFCPTPSMDVIDSTVMQFQQFKKEVGEVDAVLLNTCAARHSAFGPVFNDEAKGIFNIWQKPLIGYLSYGEIGNNSHNEKSSFHNVSCSLVTLKEK